MTEVIQEPEVAKAIALFLDALRKDYAVDEVRLYGSRARGDFRPDSDVDLAVVLPGPRGDIWKTAQAMANITFDVLGETGVAVSALPLWHDDFDHPEHAKNPALIRNIQWEGVRLSVEDQRALADAILNPALPNDALKQAAAIYSHLIAGFDNEPDEALEAQLDAEAEADYAAGRFVPHEKVREWLAKLARGERVPPPTADGN